MGFYRIDATNSRQYTQVFTMLRTAELFPSCCWMFHIAGRSKIRKLNLWLNTQQVHLQSFILFQHFMLGRYFQFGQEPGGLFGQLFILINRISLSKASAIAKIRKSVGLCAFYIIESQILVAHKTMHALPYHPQTFVLPRKIILWTSPPTDFMKNLFMLTP